MKWGVRKDIRKTGSISKKTKKKISDAVKKASYGKTKRMLNGLEDLKADYKGDKEHAKYNANKSSQKSAEKSLREVTKVSRDTLKTAKQLGYKYDKVKGQRPTKRLRDTIGTSNLIGTMALGPLGGLVANTGTLAYTNKKDREYRVNNKSVNSPYWVYDTDVYKKKKK